MDHFNVMHILFDCAIILLATKLFGMLTRKLGLPQVVGMILAGLLIGPAIFSQLGLGFNGLLNPSASEMQVLQSFSQIGVVFILFSSGLETDVKELKRSGVAASMVALAGVLLPVVLGTVVSLLFMQGFGEGYCQEKLINALFIGTILSATSVGITVETLRELGKLNTRVGTTILSAAIIDDVLGIIVLSVISSLAGGGSIWVTLLKAAGFFVTTVGVGWLMRQLFKWLIQKYPHKRRTGIFALTMCLLYAYAAEEFFDVAAITGAYMAGLMLSGLKDTSFVDRKVVVSGYMIFTPIFFAYIGISADFSQFQLGGLWFVLAFLAVAFLGKIFGCGGMAKVAGYSLGQSARIGCGMVARGEVALAVYAAGQHLIYYKNGVLAGIDPLVATICLILFSSILCPVLLKFTYKFKAPVQLVEGHHRGTSISEEALENKEHAPSHHHPTLGQLFHIKWPHF